METNGLSLLASTHSLPPSIDQLAKPISMDQMVKPTSFDHVIKLKVSTRTKGASSSASVGGLSAQRR